MIHLCSVTKSTSDGNSGRSLILREATASIPLDTRVAILGHNPTELTTLLHLLAGSEKPDQGVIRARRFRGSPIINTGPSGAGGIIARLTGLQTIEFFAEINGIDPANLLALVDARCRLGTRLRQPSGSYDKNERQALEVALITAIPYDCYFVDKIHLLKANLIFQLVHAARIRNSGLIFTTNQVVKGTRFGEVGVVVRNGTIRVFPRIDLAVMAYERH